ncbi:hypothetical protein TNCT_313961 [Trichonephila clavata]|nr:hypothetical protein TNCT_313961 [Trichonephila clavata]
MGSTKKHKEKKDRKKHKRDRSRSREKDRDSHKKSHKSSHRREKRKSPEPGSPELESRFSKRRLISGEENIPRRETEKRENRSASDDEFDVERLLDSKLSENPEFSSLKRSSKKRKREGALEELKRRHTLGENEDSLERFATEQMLEEHAAQDSVLKKIQSPTMDAHFSHEEVRIKEEP